MTHEKNLVHKQQILCISVISSYYKRLAKKLFYCVNRTLDLRMRRTGVEAVNNSS